MQRSAVNPRTAIALFLMGQVQTGFHRLSADDVHDIVGQIGEIEYLAAQLDVFAVQLAHFQYVIHQRQQVIGGGPGFLPVGLNQLRVADAAVDVQNSDDAVQRCANIVRHIVQEESFGAVGLLCLLQCVFQLLILQLFVEGRLAEISVPPEEE